MSTAINPAHSSVPASSRVSSIATNHTHTESSYANGHHHHHHDAGGSQPPGTAAGAKKGKQKKATDPNEASKLIAAKISQLELDAAGEKDQEAEIGLFAPFVMSCARYCWWKCWKILATTFTNLFLGDFHNQVIGNSQFHFQSIKAISCLQLTILHFSRVLRIQHVTTTI